MCQIRAKIHTYCHDICRRLRGLLIVLINLLTCSMKGRGEWLKFWMVSPTGPCSVKGFKCMDCIKKSWDIVRWFREMPVEHYRHAEECQAWIYIYNGRHTLSKPRKIFTHTHSSLVSFSSRILSSFSESCSSQWSSSTKASTHCRKEVMNTYICLELVMHILSFFHVIKHQIWQGPPHLHIKYKLNYRPITCLNLDSSPHFFSLWWGVFLIRGEQCHSPAKYWYLPWLQLPLQAPPHHGMLVYVHLAALDRNGVTCCRLRWASAWPGWWHVWDSSCSWVTKPGKFVD